MFETIESSEKKSQEIGEGSESTMPEWVPMAGALCAGAFFLNVLWRLGNGTGRIGLTAYGLRLLQAGMSPDTAAALDMGNMSVVMALCLLCALVLAIVGVVGFFRGGEKRAVVTALTGLAPWALVLLPLLL
jgi:hypothetical protein